MASPYRDAPGTIEERQQAEKTSLVTYNVSGARGQDGRHGQPGDSGSAHGQSGSRGGDAGPASDGQDAGAIELRLAATEIDNVARLTGITALADGSQQPIDRTQTITGEGFIELIAVGGTGGRGGTGGSGGHGASGRPGDDATRFSSGDDGGAGGDGGDGGDGSSGADGGDGGHAVIRVDDRDTHLLMLVKHALDAGRGGDAGQNGRGGSGGSGGPGGDSYSWTETDRRTDSEGNSYTDTTHHYNRGGSQGPDGRSGRPGQARLGSGRDGDDGRITYLVEADSGSSAYRARYHLLLRSFVHESSNRDLVYEPGEAITVSKLEVENIGGMPTPRHSDVHVGLEQHGWVNASEAQRIVAPRGIDAGASVVLDGSLTFKIEGHRPREAGEPLEIAETVRPFARVVAVRRDFEGFLSDEAVDDGAFVIRFPLRAEPLDSLHSLAADTAARMRWTITNQSRLELGAASSSGRRVRVRLAALESELGDDDMVMIGPEGEALTPSSGFIAEVDRLAPGDSASFEVSVGARPGAPAYKAISWRLALELGDIEAPGELETIQYREFSTRIAARYSEDPIADLLLVVNHRTDDAELATWRALASELGFTLNTWDITLEGHLDLRAVNADGRSLLDHLAGGTIVVLNNAFETPAGPAHAHQWISKADIYAANRAGVHLAFVGANPHLEQLLMPLEAGLDGSEKEPAIEESSADVVTALATVDGRDDLVVSEKRLEVHDRRWWGGLPEDADIGERAADMQDDLVAAYPDRRYVVVYDFEPTVASKFLWIKKWKVGDIQVKSTLDPALGSLVHAAASELDVHSPAQIRSDATISTLLLARDFTGNLDRLAELMAAHSMPLLEAGADEADKADDDGPALPPPAPRSEPERLMSLLVGAMLIELGHEQDAITATRWREGLSRDELRDKMPKLARLARAALGGGQLLPGSIAGMQLVELAARLRFFADSQVKLWERTPPVRFLRRAPSVAAITRQWLDELFEGAFGERERFATRMMKKRIKSFEDLDSRRTFMPRELIYAPIQSEALTTDDELFASADARTLTAAELEAAHQRDRDAESTRARLLERERAASSALLRNETTTALLGLDS